MIDGMAWRAVPRIQRQAQHLLCHIQARVNVGSFVAASSRGPAGSIRMEADGGQFDGTRPDQAGPEKDGKPLHSVGGLARPDGLFGPTNQISSHCAIPVGRGVDSLPKHGFDVGAEFMLPALGRGSAVAGKAPDSRTLMLYAVWRNP
jgi:hypothetical protein